jgi:hypothetical protein
LIRALNAATKKISHAGKITQNVRHVAIKTLGLQGLVRNGSAIFNSIGTAHYQSDHFTKPLCFPAFHKNITKMMGLQFFTWEHGVYTEQRNQEERRKKWLKGNYIFWLIYKACRSGGMLRPDSRPIMSANS